MNITAPVKEIVQGGLQLELVFALFQFFVMGIFVLYIRNVIINLVAYWSFKSDTNIHKFSWIRSSTATGFEDGQIVDFTRKRIYIKTEHGTIFVPMKKFPEQSWYVLDNKPA